VMGCCVFDKGIESWGIFVSSSLDECSVIIGCDGCDLSVDDALMACCTVFE
jgi:hypothetical protein